MTEKTLREQLQESYDEILTTDGAEPKEENAPANDVIENDIQEPVVNDEPKQEAVTNDVNEPVAPTQEDIPAPQSWKPDAKNSWATLPPNVKAEITRRENDFHKMLTTNEGELRLGKEMKDVIEPYMPSIRQSGVEPKTLINDLLGTVNVLKNGSEDQKIQVIRNIIEGYGVDINKVMSFQENPMALIQRELESIRQQANPQVIIQQLQDKHEYDNIQSEVRAFAANPANTHYEPVKAAMAPLLASGQAKDMQEAYDMACWANPTIRSTLMNATKVDESAKRKAEIASKKNAAASVTGSPSAISGNSTPPERSLRDELRANLASVQGSKI